MWLIFGWFSMEHLIYRPDPGHPSGQWIGLGHSASTACLDAKNVHREPLGNRWPLSFSGRAGILGSMPLAAVPSASAIASYIAHRPYTFHRNSASPSVTYPSPLPLNSHIFRAFPAYQSSSVFFSVLQASSASRAMASSVMSVNVAGVQALNAAPASSSHVHLSSASRLGGFRLNLAHAGVSVRTPARPSTVVVRAEDVVDKVQNAVGGAANKVKDTAGAAKDKVQDAAGAAKGKLEDAGNYLADKVDEAEGNVKDASRDAQKEAGKLGDKAADAGRDLEGSAKDATRDARGEAENLGVSVLPSLDDCNWNVSLDCHGSPVSSSGTWVDPGG